MESPLGIRRVGPRELHPEPLTDSVLEPLDSHGSCHPLDWRIGTFGLTVPPLVPFPFASPTRFSSSVQKARIRVTPPVHRTSPGQ